MTTYKNQAYARCQADLAACNQQPVAFAQRAERTCARRADGVPSSIRATEIEYSYFTYGVAGKLFGATDVYFRFKRYTTAVSFVVRHRRELHPRGVSEGNVTAASPRAIRKTSRRHCGSRSATSRACRRRSFSVATIPTFDFTNMVASVRLTGLAPSADGQRVTMRPSPAASRSIEREELSDPIVSALVDVRARSKISYRRA